MSTLIVFIIVALLFAFTLAVFIILPWLQTSGARATQRQADNQLLALNIQVFKQRRAELENDHQEGRIDTTTYETQKIALERQLLEIGDNQEKNDFVPNWKSRLIFLVWIPLLTVMAYMMIADRTPVYKLWEAQDRLGKVADDLLTAKIDTPPEWATKDSVGLISAMQTNVHHHANDPLRWFRLSEVFVALQAPEQAIESLARAYRLNPDDERVALTYAQTSFFTQGGQMDNTIRQVVEHILVKNPKHQGAQMLMAMGEMRLGNYPDARKWVAALKTDIQNRPGDHTQALQSLAELEQTIDQREAQSAKAIEVHIKVTPEILGRIKQGETLFVNVKKLAGGPPVAAKKLSADTLNINGMTLKISDNDSIMPTVTLSDAISSAEPLVISARVSASGDATPKSGDLTSNPVPFESSAQVTTVLVDKIIP